MFYNSYNYIWLCDPSGFNTDQFQAKKRNKLIMNKIKGESSDSPRYIYVQEIGTTMVLPGDILY